MTPLVVCDLDGTLCNVAHRVAFAQQSQWDEFHRQSPNDTPHVDVWWTLRALRAYQTMLLFLTGCSDTYRPQREHWLMTQAGFRREEYHLLMRPSGNHLSDVELKPLLLDAFLTNNKQYRLLFVMEDRDRVVARWREIGYPCFHVRPGAY